MKTYKFIVTMEVPEYSANGTFQVSEDLKFILEQGFVQDVKITIERYRETHVSNLVREDYLLEEERTNPCAFELTEIY